MSIQAAAGGCFNSTFTASGTKQDLADNIETALLAAGWTTISGSGTSNLLMQTGTTPYGHQMNFRFKAQTNCVVISIESTDGTTIVGGNSTTAGIPLLPVNTEIWRVIANQFQFCIFVDASPTVARRFAIGSVPYVPSFLTGVAYAGLLMGNAINDSDTTSRASFRTLLGLYNNGCANYQAVYGSTIFENANSAIANANAANSPSFCEVPQTAGGGGRSTINTFYVMPYHWANGDVITCDTWIAFALSLTTTEFMKRFQLWDSIILLDGFTAGGTPTTTTIASRTCQNITDSNFGGNTNSARGSLFLFTA